MTRRPPKSAASLREQARREQRGRVSPEISYRFVEAQPKRHPEIVWPDSPASDKQRIVLAELRREQHRPRHGISLLTRKQASEEIAELMGIRRKRLLHEPQE